MNVIRILRGGAVAGVALSFGALASPAFAVNAGDTVYFRAKWQGPAAGNPVVPNSWANVVSKENFPVHGILIEAVDVSNPSNKRPATILNGVATFAAPSPEFTLVVSAAFAGYNSAAAAGIPGDGTFAPYCPVVLRDNTNAMLRLEIPDGEDWVTTSPQAPLPEFTFNGLASRGGAEWVENMAALHGLAAAGAQLMRRTGIEVTISPLLMTWFSSAGSHSHYEDTTGHLILRRDECFVWDRLAVATAQAMLASELVVTPVNVDPSPAGNQYEYAPAALTYHNKDLSQTAAFYHGLSMALGVTLTEGMTDWAGRIWGVGDRKLADEPLEMESNAVPSRGCDSPRGIAGMIWDLCDVSGDSATVSGISLKDRSRVSWKTMLNPSFPEMSSVGDFWNLISELKPYGMVANPPQLDGLYDLLGQCEVMARWGMAAVVTSPVASQLLTLDAQASQRLKIKWSLNDTGPDSMKCHEFSIVVLNAAMDQRLWVSPWLTPAPAANHEYELTTQEMANLNAAVLASGAESGVVTIVSRNPGAGSAGPLSAGNKVRVFFKPVMRASVVAVDVSRSSPWADPARAKVQAASDYLSQFIPSVTLQDGTRVLQDQLSVLSYGSTVGVVSDWAEPGQAVERLQALLPIDEGETDYPDAFNTALDMLGQVRPQLPNVGSAVVEVKKTLTILTDGDYYKPWFIAPVAEQAMWDRLAASEYEILEVSFWSTDGSPPISVGGIRNLFDAEPPPRVRRKRGLEVTGNMTRLYIRDRELPRMLEYVPAKFLPFGQPVDGTGNQKPDDAGNYSGYPGMEPTGFNFYAAAGSSNEVRLERPVEWDPETAAQIIRDFTPVAIIQAPDGSLVHVITLPTENGEDFESFSFTAPTAGNYTVVVQADPRSSESGIWSIKVPAGGAGILSPAPSVFEMARAQTLPDGSLTMTFAVPPDDSMSPWIRVLFSDGVNGWDDSPGFIRANAAGYALWTDRDAGSAPRRFYKAERVPLNAP